MRRAAGGRPSRLQRTPATPPRVRRAVKLTLLTSGTTGLTKGVPRAIKPRELVLMCVTAMVTNTRSRDRVFVTPPFFHGFGLAALLGPLALGATALCRRIFDAAQAIEDIARERLTVLMALPGLHKGLACGLPLRLIVTRAEGASRTTAFTRRQLGAADTGGQ
ncbi:acyl-CoA synthetase (AMP-forming)/AMP-acid ligase II [Mycobacteroides chelonae]|nr:acyl-CoA synthetase (AMP-forming)/AMP-acid ligase II [Mycobacteroides chelonae]